MKTKLTILLACVMLISGCSNFPSGKDILTPGPTPSSPETPNPEEDSDTPPQGLMTLQVWVPPQFDPSLDTPAAQLFQARLEEFSRRHPGVRVSVRVKALEGPAGLLESLRAAQAAAPLALPDIVALPARYFEEAYDKNLVYFMENYLSGSSENDWYEYAASLGELDGHKAGLTIAGDALILAYRPSTVGNAPLTWDEALEKTGPLAFAGADPAAIFPLALYQANGGNYYNESGGLSLDEQPLGELFTFLETGALSNSLPFWLTQYDQDVLAWQAFRENRAQMAITWSSQFFSNAPEELSAAPLPTAGGQAFTLADGWVWALTAPNPDRHQAAVELAEYLTEAEFIGPWTQSIGLLPPRSGALSLWEVTPYQALASQILPEAVPLPPNQVLAVFGRLFSENTISILKQEIKSIEAIEKILGTLNGD
ncbi:MAG: extracellular solute-binding protein [Anaerolineae bacterium]|nr:extracellular solute-binding protein [Anaerolineae bacterium]